MDLSREEREQVQALGRPLSTGYGDAVALKRLTAAIRRRTQNMFGSRAGATSNRVTSSGPPIGGRWWFAAQESMVSTLADPREVLRERGSIRKPYIESRGMVRPRRLGPRQR